VGGEQPLATGCYLVNFAPRAAPLVSYDGTMRVEASTGPLLASGDLYLRDVVLAVLDDGSETAVLGPAPDPTAGIPILPIANYRYYMRVTSIRGAPAGVGLAFELRWFSAQDVTLFDGSVTRWPQEGAFTALMSAAPAAPGFPSPGHVLAGDVADADGTTVGRLSMVLVSPFLRRATLEMDRVPVCELPLDNGAGITWKTVFDKVGWNITIQISDSDVEEPSGEAWNRAEAHAAMLDRRDKSNLDAEWRYYLLAVRQTDVSNGERGVMFDEGATDADNLPREGLMVASHWVFPDAAPWGLVKGLRAGTTGTYFRTAVHEFGHAMGLDHNDGDNFFMRPTNGIAEDADKTSDTPFPTNVVWSYSREDEHRLRHWPDPMVRPGGIRTHSGAQASLSAIVSDSHRLDVTPVLPSLPLGAPVRVEVRLTNTGVRRAVGPQSLSLSAGAVRGEVVDAAGAVRSFSPLAVDESTNLNSTLEPGGHIDDSLTLLRGAEGALFPLPGAYRIVVRASWSFDGVAVFAAGTTSVTVTAAVNADHAEAAARVLSTPDVLLTLAFGGEHLEDGIAAIHAALKNEVLRPHFAYAEAKRLGTRFGRRPANRKAAAALIDDTIVMSQQGGSVLLVDLLWCQ
jgi:hypothetical protein